MGEWVLEKCSVDCDNGYDSAMPYKCGGWQEMKREIVVRCEHLIVAGGGLLVCLIALWVAGRNG